VPQIGPGVGAAAPLDLGRGELINQEFYRFTFRAPPLRNVELTAPYFHNGAYPTLEAVVAHYNNAETALRTYSPAHLTPAVQALYHGDAATENDVALNLDFSLRPGLELTETEMANIVAFLKSLTDPAARNLSHVAPASVPSGLPLN
jgi:cytochrome c peroxidase